MLRYVGRCTSSTVMPTWKHLRRSDNSHRSRQNNYILTRLHSTKLLNDSILYFLPHLTCPLPYSTQLFQPISITFQTKCKRNKHSRRWRTADSVHISRDNFPMLVSLLLHDRRTVAVTSGHDPGGRRGASLGLGLGSTGLQRLVDLCNRSTTLEVLGDTLQFTCCTNDIRNGYSVEHSSDH
jgi:hypothetical protein